MNPCARYPHFLPLSQAHPHLLEWKTETQKGGGLTYLFVPGFSTRSGTSISSPCDPPWSVVCWCSMVLTVLSAEAIPLSPSSCRFGLSYREKVAFCSECQFGKRSCPSLCATKDSWGAFQEEEVLALSSHTMYLCTGASRAVTEELELGGV